MIVRSAKKSDKVTSKAGFYMMLGPKAPNYDIYGLFRASHSHNPDIFYIIIWMIPENGPKSIFRTAHAQNRLKPL